MNVVVVESPAKAKTINKYLGKDYKVLASYGHVRDLPSKDGSVDPDHDFEMRWEVDAKSAKRLKELADAVKCADKLYLATDPDREGEAISWHILEVLKNKRGVLNGTDVKRVVFPEITKSAILKGMAEPRDLDTELINAYLARRALDYLVGFTLSPVLWRKLPGARSAGRVQSVALRLICEREQEIEQFVAQEYWTLEADFSVEDKVLTARLYGLDGKKLDKFDLNTEKAAHSALERVKAGDFKVEAVEKSPAKRHPQPPFTTSTLQQEASRKLGFAASRTMRVAQSLYEGKNINGETTGLITYMRTDGVQLADEAINASRKLIASTYGDRYVPKARRVYKSKAKNAQEAHEAIRPTDPSLKPAKVRSALDEDEYKLYDLIWKRTIASQMESAQLERTRIEIQTPNGDVHLRANGSVVVFEGFLKVYQVGYDDGEGEDGELLLPAVKQGQALNQSDARADQHFTEPPPRFSEASLVKRMEQLGIGRPSTYASILSVLRDRNYVHMDRNRFIPEDKGRLVIAFLENFFERYVEYDFTARLEEQLDEVSGGREDWKKLLNSFWVDFHAKAEEMLQVRNAVVLDTLTEYLAPFIFPEPEDGSDPRACKSCETGKLSLKTSRYGAFIGCSNYPDCKYTRPFSSAEQAEQATDGDGPKVLGEDPETGLEITLRDGRFGPYLQLGEGEKGSKPKRASIPRDTTPDQVTLEQAIALLSLPREVGAHPETGKPIMANIGRFGPYVQHEKTYGKLSSTDEVFSVGLNRAVTLLAESKNRSSGSELKDLGEHPEDGKPVKVMDGRYGPYVKHNKTNATLPKGSDPQAITMDEAVQLLAAREAKRGGGGKKKAAPKKSPQKKTAPKKAASTKSANGEKTRAS